MGTVSPQQVSDGSTIDASDVNTPINTIANEFNGNIDNTNIKTAAAIAGSKLADASINVGLKASTWDGWIAVSDSWTYASATTITVPSDATAKYSVGDKIKIVQSASTKYFYITGVAATTLTVNGGTDYTVANSAISSIYYSKAASPLSFPQYFNYTYTLAASGGGSPIIGNGTITGTRFSMTGKTVHFQFKLTLGSTTSFGTGELQFTLPVTGASTVGNNMHIGSVYIIDVSAGQDYNAWISTISTTAFRIDCVNAAAPARIAVVSGSGSTPFAWATSDFIAGSGSYEAA